MAQFYVPKTRFRGPSGQLVDEIELRGGDTNALFATSARPWDDLVDVFVQHGRRHPDRNRPQSHHGNRVSDLLGSLDSSFEYYPTRILIMWLSDNVFIVHDDVTELAFAPPGYRDTGLVVGMNRDAFRFFVSTGHPPGPPVAELMAMLQVLSDGVSEEEDFVRIGSLSSADTRVAYRRDPTTVIDLPPISPETLRGLMGHGDEEVTLLLSAVRLPPAMFRAAMTHPQGHCKTLELANTDWSPLAGVLTECTRRNNMTVWGLDGVDLAGNQLVQFLDALKSNTRWRGVLSLAGSVAEELVPHLFSCISENQSLDAMDVKFDYMSDELWEMICHLAQQGALVDDVGIQFQSDALVAAVENGMMSPAERAVALANALPNDRCSIDISADSPELPVYDKDVFRLVLNLKASRPALEKLRKIKGDNVRAGVAGRVITDPWHGPSADRRYCDAENPEDEIRFLALQQNMDVLAGRLGQRSDNNRNQEEHSAGPS